jgi:transcriptional regulator
MYLPPQFQTKDPATAVELMRAHPLAQLISSDDTGCPFVTPLPLHVVEEVAGKLSLLGHVAKLNSHAGFLRTRPQALVVFQGPQAYMTPRVYPDLVRVPTWSYLAVHARVGAHIIETFDDKDRLLKHLIHDHDPTYAEQWRGLGEAYQHKMVAGIVAFELRMTDLQCKVKLNQHRPESHAAMYTAYAVGNADEQTLARWMVRLGMVSSEQTEKPCV